MEKTKVVKEKTIPNMGWQVLLEYQNVSTVDLKNIELIKKEVTEFFKNNHLEVAEELFVGEAESEYTFTFILPDGYLNLQCLPKLNNFVSFDMYLFDPKQQPLIDLAYTHFASFFGNLQGKTSFYQQKGVDNKFLLNANEFTSAIYKNMKMVHRQQSQLHEIRVFDNEFLGRILTINDEIKLDGTVDGDYSKDMTKSVVASGKELENVLIIGGANTQIATYLLREYKNIKKIIISDVDKEVFEVVLKFFPNAPEIEQAIKDKKLEIYYENGAKFVEEMKQKGNKFDIIIIDTVNSNQGNWNNEKECIFTKNFYENLKQILLPNAKFSQQLVNNHIKEKFQAIVKGIDFKIEYINSKTDDYGLDLPIVICSL